MPKSDECEAMRGGIAVPSEQKQADSPPKPGECDGEVEELGAKDELECDRAEEAEADVQSTLDHFERKQMTLMAEFEAKLME
eukprot:1968612-Alexandrium_andersonii.AAC.1